MSSCSGLGNLKDPREVCEFARQNCSLGSVVPYATVVFCWMYSQAARILLLSVGICLISGSMGVAAFDYLSPNLTYIAEKSALPQSLMGVTVLAFGNGSVDVFGAFVALKSGEGGMAVGEIMGGAFFVITVVVGSMAIISPFKVTNSVPIDMIVLQLATCYTLVIISDGIITMNEALVGLLGYVAYSLYVVLSHIYQSKTDQHLPPIPSIEEPQTPFRATPELESQYGSEGLYTPVRPSLYSAVDLNWKVNKRLEELDSSETMVPQTPIQHMPDHSTMNEEEPHNIPAIKSPPSPGHSGHTRRRSSAPELQSTNIGEFGVPQNQSKAIPADLPKLRIETPQDTLLPVTSARSYHSSQMLGSGSPNLTHRRHLYSPYTMNDLVDQLLDVHQLESQLNSPNPATPQAEDVWSVLNECAAENEHNEEDNPVSILQLLCPSMSKWNELTWIHRGVLIPMLPILILLAWSVPLSCNSKSLAHICLHAVVVPFIMPVVMPSLDYSRSVVLVQFSIALIGIMWWKGLGRPLPSSLFVATVGFFMGILWVVLLATELVNILTVLGEVCNVSTTVMGLTVFALGDSLGDFVSNITVAQIGYPTMAVAACYGGPIFTLLVGVSGAAMATMLLQGQSQLTIPSHMGLVYSAVAIVLTLTMLLVQMRFNGSRITKTMGVQLIAIWCLYIISSVYLLK